MSDRGELSLLDVVKDVKVIAAALAALTGSGAAFAHAPAWLFGVMLAAGLIGCAVAVRFMLFKDKARSQELRRCQDAHAHCQADVRRRDKLLAACIVHASTREGKPSKGRRTGDHGQPGRLLEMFEQELGSHAQEPLRMARDFLKASE